MIQFVLCIIIFGTIGLGPALYFVSYRSPGRQYNAFLLAPVIGLGLTTLLITNVVYAFDIAIADYAIAFLTVLILVSILLTIIYMRHLLRSTRRSIFSLATLSIIVAMLIIAGLLLLPGEVGGPAYRLWQSNVYDWTNYNLIAFYQLNFNEAHFLAPTEYQEIVALFPGLYFVGRPGVGYVLGWFSYLLSVPTYELTHYYILALIFCVFPTSIVLGRLLQFRLRYNLLFSGVLTLGFWTYAISDINALSQISSISMVLLTLYAWIDLEQRKPDGFLSRERLLLIVAITFIFILYPELLPLLAVTFAAYYLLRWFDEPSRRIVRRAANHIGSGIGVLVLALPTVGHTLSYIQSQTTTGANLDVDWQLFLFPWLYSNDNIFTNLWGLHLYTSPFDQGTVLLLIMLSVSCAIIFCLVALLIHGYTHTLARPAKHPAASLLLCLTGAYWGAGLVLHIWGQHWAGGKALLMGAPFMVTSLFLFAYPHHSRQRIGNGYIQKVAVYVIPIIFGVWVVSQLSTPFVRTVVAAQDASIRDYPPLRTPEVDEILDITNIIENEDNPTVYSFLADTRDAYDGLRIMMLSDATDHHITVTGVFYLDPTPPQSWPRDDSIPEYLVFDAGIDNLRNSPIGDLLTPSDNFLSLYRVTPSDVDAVNMNLSFLALEDRYRPRTVNFDQPFILDPTDGALVRWMVQDYMWLRFIASGEIPYCLYWDGIPAYTGTMRVTLEDTQQIIDEYNLIADAETHARACFTPTPGTNDLTFTHIPDTLIDTPARLLIRDMLLIPETSRIDIGYTDVILLGDGWEGAELWGDESVRWANQQTSFIFLLNLGNEDLRLRFRAFLNTDLNSDEQTVTVRINDEVQATVVLLPGWQEYEVTIASEVIIPDAPQRATLSHAWAVVPPGDAREVAAAYDWFSFEAVEP